VSAKKQFLTEFALQSWSVISRVKSSSSQTCTTA